MLPCIVENMASLTALCQKHQVKTLYLFGSGAQGDWNPERSDLDFMVEFQNCALPGDAPDFFGLLHGLEDLFGRKIDLVMQGCTSNPYFLNEVQSHRQVLYAS